MTKARNDILPTRVYIKTLQREDTDDNLPVRREVDLILDSSIPAVLGYTYYSAVVPGPNFSFDLFSDVDGETFSEDNRETQFWFGG